MSNRVVPFRKERLCILLALGLLAGCLSRTQGETVEGDGRSFIVENDVPEGATVALKPSRSEYFVGETVLANFVIENTGTVPFRVSFEADMPKCHHRLRYLISATSESGERAKEVEAGYSIVDGFVFEPIIKPGETFNQWLWPLRHFEITRPGRYTLRVSHHFGWKEGKRRRPVAEAVVNFKMPGPEEAAAIITRMAKDGATNTRWREADFGTLRLPVYLQPLLKLAESGERRDPLALEGIASIQTPEAMEALIRLARERGAFSLDAARLVADRLPEEGVLNSEWQRKRRQQALRGWSPELRPGVIQLANELLASANPDSLVEGAKIIGVIGTAEEGNVIIPAIDRLLAEKTNSGKDSADPGVPLHNFVNAIKKLRNRGFKVEKWNSSAGAAFVSFELLAGTPGRRPVGWAKGLEIYADEKRGFVRATALRSIPVPMPSECFAVVMKALADPLPEVRKAAVEVAGGSGDKRFIAPLMSIITTEQHERLWEQTFAALSLLGLRSELWLAAVKRMEDDQIFESALDSIQFAVVEDQLEGWSVRKTDRESRDSVCQQWKRFLIHHREELDAGKRFKIGGPQLSSSLFESVRVLELKGGRVWPPE